MVTALSNLFTWLGFSRDDTTWFHLQLWPALLLGASLVYSGKLDPAAGILWLTGYQLSVIQGHLIEALAVLLLWIGGKMSTSQLFAKGQVPKS